MKNISYNRQVELLLKVLPLLNEYEDFALKGGTAINYFIRDLPRLSVDIDLCYLPIQERDESLNKITSNIKDLSKQVSHYFPSARFNFKTIGKSSFLKGLILNLDNILIKLEVNLIIRGSANKPFLLKTKKNVEDEFKMSCKMKVLSFEDIYAGKICAALDRQHPRDLFDIKLLLENEGISDLLRKTFLLYLIQSNRPIIELLNPNILDISNVYEREFRGMTRAQVSLKDLEDIQINLPCLIRKTLTNEEKKFLLDFKKQEEIDWNLLGLGNFSKLPGVKWKIHNIEKMDKTKHQEQLQNLSNYLNQLN
ncbi:MAG: nucleotidyl transferase AbiEii/AbiGii toxin family protein [Pseudomonadota bacterium]